jgi:hypothetical protein
LSAVKHFLLVYDRPTGDLVQFREFADYGDALNERFRLERVRTNPHHEIVVLSAESQDNLKRTHSRYFKSVEEQLRSATLAS